MQTLPVGAVVRARGERWRVVGVRSYDDSQAVTLRSSSRARHRDGAPRERVFLEPFEGIRPLATTSRPRPVLPRSWRAVCRAVLAEETPPGSLRAAVRANVDVWPHQFAPALALVRGLGCRVLLAPVAVVSVDYVKRPEVLAGLAQWRWDAVVVDEAHGAAADSDRHRAVHALARRASYVVLVTATPHNGDRQAFESLCGIGAIDEDALLTFLPLVGQEARSDALRQLASQL